MKKTNYHLFILVLGFIVIITLGSCANSKKLSYFNNIPRDTVTNIQAQLIDTKISKNDILQIAISTLDDATNKIFQNASVSAAAGNEAGYLVDESGIIKLPLIGSIKVEGFTKAQLATMITDQLNSKQLAKDPIVTVRIVNYKITVWGEVARPGVIQVPSERITLPEALAQAGDLTVYGRRSNVLLIREVEGKRISKRFSLNNDQMFDKDIYNLRNQDIIYVEPNNAKAAQIDRVSQNVPLALSTISLLILLYVQFVKK